QAAKQEHEIAAAAPHENSEDKGDRKEGAGKHGIGDGIQPDQFRLPLKARAVRGKRRHVQNISKKRLQRRKPRSDPSAGTACQIIQVSGNRASTPPAGEGPSSSPL